MKEKCELKRQDVPKFAKEFRCLLLRHDTDLDVRQQIAGADQARQANVMSNSLAVKANWFLREWMQRVASNPDMTPDKTSVLNVTYTKMGCTSSKDGAPVCTRTHV